jgi:AraC-like DNA-binding protein
MQLVRDPADTSDALGRTLGLLRMSGTFYCRSELTARWGVTIPSKPGHMWFHVVTEGEAWLEVGDGGAQLLRQGSFALLPRNARHRMRSDPGAPAPDVLALEREKVSERYEILRHGEGGRRTTLFCGAVRFTHPAARALVDALPASLVIDAARAPQMEWMRSTLGLIADEARELQPGHEAVLTRLGDVLAIQGIRSWVRAYPAARTGWLGALRDPLIGRAVSLIHRDPARAWAPAELAREIGMSRSAFCARFTELVGEPMMHYVTRWRMYLALDALKEGSASVAQLSSRLGYQSEAAFSRAFKRVITVPPGEIRRNRSAANRGSRPSPDARSDTPAPSRPRA